MSFVPHIGKPVEYSPLEPVSNYVNICMTDLYQITMAYAYWQNGRQDEAAVFDLFFRTNPFKGEYTIFAGLEECLKLVNCLKFTDEQVEYLKTVLPDCDPAFFEWLLSVDSSKVKIFAFDEGSFVFPREPVIRVEGPLGVCQLLETPLLNCCNFASLVTTNACRHKLAAGKGKTLMEFGLRRAQGPDGAMSASRYSIIGGFDSTSNVLAGMLYGIPINGTHAHAFVQSYYEEDQIKVRMLKKFGTEEVADFYEACKRIRADLKYSETNDGEFYAFVAYGIAFPRAFVALVDTYDTLKSGVPNFICVALALKEFGYNPSGVRLDSGDLAYLSKETRKIFVEALEKYPDSGIDKCKIVASNDINEEVLLALEKQGHEIDTFGIGTNLVTCQKQPALGMVYKLVELNGVPRIKLSQAIEKVTIPSRKDVYRLINGSGQAMIDVMQFASEEPPKPGE